MEPAEYFNQVQDQSLDDISSDYSEALKLETGPPIDLEALDSNDKLKIHNTGKLFETICRKSHLPLGVAVSISSILVNGTIGTIATYEAFKRTRSARMERKRSDPQEIKGNQQRKIRAH